MFFSQYNLIISSVINFTLVSCQKISVETLPMTEGQYGVHVVAFRGVGGASHRLLAVAGMGTWVIRHLEQEDYRSGRLLHLCSTRLNSLIPGQAKARWKPTWKLPQGFNRVMCVEAKDQKLVGFFGGILIDHRFTLNCNPENTSLYTVHFMGYILL